MLGPSATRRRRSPPAPAAPDVRACRSMERAPPTQNLDPVNGQDGIVGHKGDALEAGKRRVTTKVGGTIVIATNGIESYIPREQGAIEGGELRLFALAGASAP